MANGTIANPVIECILSRSAAKYYDPAATLSDDQTRELVRIGTTESKVNDGKTRIHRAGESWSEPPGATHSISRNASKTEPARLLAVFILDTNDKALTTPIK